VAQHDPVGVDGWSTKNFRMIVFENLILAVRCPRSLQVKGQQ